MIINAITTVDGWKWRWLYGIFIHSTTFTSTYTLVSWRRRHNDGNIFIFFPHPVDDRIKDLFLLRSPWPVIGIVVAYLFFVNGKGQNWMKDRKPFELNSIINVYNVVQVFLNLYLGTGVSGFFFPVDVWAPFYFRCFERSCLLSFGRKTWIFFASQHHGMITQLLAWKFFIIRTCTIWLKSWICWTR